MVDAPEPPAEAADAPVEQPSAPVAAQARAPRRRRLDGRTIAICAVVALLAALVAALVASAVLRSDDETAGASGEEDELTLEPADGGNVDALLGMGLLTVDGDPTTLYQHLGDERTLVNYWQSTCAPCIKEMPLLEAARADNPDVAVVGIATQDRLPQAKELAAQTGITYPWFQDPKGLSYYESKGAGMPTTLLLDAEGTVLAIETGAFQDAAELQRFLDEHPG